MKRALLVGVILLPAALLVAIVLLAAPAPGTRDQVTSAIDSYLQYRAPYSRSINSIQRRVPAASPGNFTPEMSKSTFGNGNYFKSNFHSVTARVDWLGQKPLPYPPVAVWCVRLLPSGDHYPAIVFVAQHEDDYHAEWIVHDPAAESASALTDQLARLGCSEIEKP